MNNTDLGTPLDTCLVDLYNTNPLALQHCNFKQFNDAQQQSLVVYLSRNQPKDYNPHVLRNILTHLGTRVVFNDRTFAQHFLYMCIMASDTDNVAFILDTFEVVRDGEGRCEAWDTYLMTSCNTDYLVKSAVNYDIVRLLLKHFTDERIINIAVNQNDRTLFDIIHPHCDPKSDMSRAYQLALINNNAEFEALLEYESNIFEAFYQLKLENKHQNAIGVLQKKILNGWPQEECQIYTQLYNNPAAAIPEIGNVLRHQLGVLLASDNCIQATKNLLAGVDTLLNHDDDSNVCFVAQLLKHPTLYDFVVERLDSKEIQRQLGHCAFLNNQELAFILVANGASIDKAIEILDQRNKERMHSQLYKVLHKQSMPMRERLVQWRAMLQLHTTLSEITSGMGTDNRSPKM